MCCSVMYTAPNSTGSTVSSDMCIDVPTILVNAVDCPSVRFRGRSYFVGRSSTENFSESANRVTGAVGGDELSSWCTLTACHVWKAPS